MPTVRRDADPDVAATVRDRAIPCRTLLFVDGDAEEGADKVRNGSTALATCGARTTARPAVPARCHDFRRRLSITGRARHIAAGRIQGASRPIPVASARLHEAPQGLAGVGALSWNSLLGSGAITGEADRVLGPAVRTGAPSASPPNTSALDTGSEVAVAPVAARPLPRTPSRVFYASLRGDRHATPPPLT